MAASCERLDTGFPAAMIEAVPSLIMSGPSSDCVKLHSVDGEEQKNRADEGADDTTSDLSGIAGVTCWAL